MQDAYLKESICPTQGSFYGLKEESGRYYSGKGRAIRQDEGKTWVHSAACLHRRHR